MARSILGHIGHAVMFCGSAIVASMHHEFVSHAVRVTVEGSLYGIFGAITGGMTGGSH